MQFGNYNKEEKEKSKFDIYVKAILFGILGAFGLIFGGLALKFIIKYLIEYWVWVIVIVVVLFLAKKFFFKSDKIKKQNTPTLPEEYSQ